jgi:hypothetical protein
MEQELHEGSVQIPRIPDIHIKIDRDHGMRSAVAVGNMVDTKTIGFKVAKKLASLRCPVFSRSRDQGI